jgi:hypothetical protein
MPFDRGDGDRIRPGTPEMSLSTPLTLGDSIGPGSASGTEHIAPKRGRVSSGSLEDVVRAHRVEHERARSSYVPFDSA